MMRRNRAGRIPFFSPPFFLCCANAPSIGPRAALLNRLWKTYARGVDESLMEIDFAVSNLSSVQFFSQENVARPLCAISRSDLSDDGWRDERDPSIHTLCIIDNLRFTIEELGGRSKSIYAFVKISHSKYSKIESLCNYSSTVKKKHLI